jgi:hypothetical protein
VKPSRLPAAALVSTDLDRTMIFSKGAVAESGLCTDELVVVERYKGEAASWMTSAAVTGLRRLAREAAVVPTTTRTIEQYQRIALPGAPWRYAVTSNGGNILVDGVPDAGWRAAMADEATGGGTSAEEAAAEVESRVDASWARPGRICDGLFHYFCADLALMPADFMGGLAQWCEPRGWNVSRQGRKIYTMPNSVTKSRAVAEVRRRLVDEGRLEPGAAHLASGDGGLDRDMLMAADRAIRPRHGELEALGFTHPNLVVTRAKGALAGEEMVGWLLQSAGITVAAES